MNTETKLPATPRRTVRVEAAESFHPPSGGPQDFYDAPGSGLKAALLRRVSRAYEAVEAAWPLGTEREERNLVVYQRAVRRWLVLKRALGCVICGDAPEAFPYEGSAAILVERRAA